MELKKVLTPWNWVKKEEAQTRQSPSTVLTQSGTNSFNRLHHDIDRLFEDFFRGFPLSPFFREGKSVAGSLLLPQVNIAEGKKDYSITVEAPGVEEQDIDLTLVEGTLTIRGKKGYEKEDHHRQYHRIERSYGSFQRVISLPTDADENEAKAKFKNGVLTISVGKNVSAAPSYRRIVINEG